jgi:hypothetical protein
MPATGHRSTAVLLLTVSLLLAAAPAAAATEGPVTGPPLGSAVFQTVSSWLSALWSEMSPVFNWEPAREAIGPGADPGVAPQATTDDPTAEPELGSGADPNG